MGRFGEWRDPMRLNGTDRSIKVKAYLTENYDGFGSGYDEHKKYLPCMAILERLSGDNSRLWRPLPFLKKLKE